MKTGTVLAGFKKTIQAGFFKVDAHVTPLIKIQLAIKMQFFTISGMDLEENNHESVSLRYFPAHRIKGAHILRFLKNGAYICTL